MPVRCEAWHCLGFFWITQSSLYLIPYSSRSFLHCVENVVSANLKIGVTCGFWWLLNHLFHMCSFPKLLRSDVPAKKLEFYRSEPQHTTTQITPDENTWCPFGSWEINCCWLIFLLLQSSCEEPTLLQSFQGRLGCAHGGEVAGDQLHYTGLWMPTHRARIACI